MQGSTPLAAAGSVLVACGCLHGGARSAAPTRPCDGANLASYSRTGRALTGDVDGDGRADRVTLREDTARPAACRRVLVVKLGRRVAAAPIRPLAWPGTDPVLILLVEIDARRGLEPVIDLSPANPYRPGAVFAVRDGRLRRMRLEGARPADLFPLDDEFPAGVDCGRWPGTIVVTRGGLAQGGADDRHWDIVRSTYRAAGVRFQRVRSERFRIAVGPEAQRRWPEVGGRPFRTCAATRS